MRRCAYSAARSGSGPSPVCPRNGDPWQRTLRSRSAAGGPASSQLLLVIEKVVLVARGEPEKHLTMTMKRIILRKTALRGAMTPEDLAPDLGQGGCELGTGKNVNEVLLAGLLLGHPHIAECLVERVAPLAVPDVLARRRPPRRHLPADVNVVGFAVVDVDYLGASRIGAVGKQCFRCFLIVSPLRNGFRGIGIGFLTYRFRVSFVSRVFWGCVPLRSRRSP